MLTDDYAVRATVCKLHLDLWLHQNTLMWSRVQTLYFVQAGFLALAHVLSENPKYSQYALWPCLLAVVATIGLGIAMWTDRQLRNIHRTSIETYKLDLYPASTAQKPLSEDFGSSFIEPTFHLSIFLVFVVVDLLAASALGLPAQWVVGSSLAVLLVYFIALAYFYGLFLCKDEIGTEPKALS